MIDSQNAFLVIGTYYAKIIYISQCSVQNVIGKLLLIRESGILPFRLNQDEYDIDDDLLSGFCVANYNIARELQDCIDMLLMKNNNKIIFHEFSHLKGDKFIMAAFCNKYHIDEGIKQKMAYIFDEFFSEYKFECDSEVINNPEIHSKIKDVLNDTALKRNITTNIEFIKSIINPIIEEECNNLYAYAITSSTNQILHIDAKKDLLKYRINGETIESVVEEYLNVWNMKTVPQGDVFQGFGLLTGLDLVDFVNTDSKMYGLCINTSINLKKEPQNELLLYVFGKNTLMRQCLIDIEEILRENIVDLEEIVS